MGTQLLRLALLLAALQYAAVQAATVACPGAPDPKSECPTGLDARIGCTDLTGTGFPGKDCATGKKKVVRFGNSGKWSSLSEPVTCVNGKWNFKVYGDTAVKVLGAGDNFVCALDRPDATPCEWCREPADADCKQTEGCVVGTKFKNGNNPTDRCSYKECAADDRFNLDIPTTSVISKITCNPSMKWEAAGVEVTKALCVKKAKCTVKAPIDTACSPDVKTGVVCAPVDLKDDTALACKGTNRLFIKKGAAWEEATTPVTCNQVTGTWMKDNAVAAITRAICADGDPTPVAAIKCSTANPIVATCPHTDVNTAANCEASEVVIKDDAPLACVASTYTLYVSGGAGWLTGTVTCEPTTGKWKLDGVETPITRAVCTAADPTVPCQSCVGPLPTATCDPTFGCTEGAAPTAETDAVTHCKELACATGEVFLYNTDKITAVDAKIVCSESKKWQVADTEVVDAVCVTEFLCQKKTPLKTSCDRIEDSDCVEIADFMVDELTCADPATQLYVKPRSLVWVPAGAVLFCDKKTGQWKRGADKDNAEPMTENESVVCAKTLPVAPLECPILDFACDPTHLAGVAPNVACEEVADKTAEDLKCVPIPDIPCPPNPPPNCQATKVPQRKLFFKHVNNLDSTHYQQAEFVKCNTVTGKWEIDFKYGLNTIKAEELKKDSHVICALTSPEPKVCPYGRTVPSDYTAQVESDGLAPGAAVGEKGACPKEPYAIISSEANKDYLSKEVFPVCSQTGRWERPTDLPVAPAVDAPIKVKYEFYGDKIACGSKKCLSCKTVPTGPITGVTVELRGLTTISKGGTCAMVACPAQDPRFAIKVEPDSEVVYYTRETVTCSNDEKWMTAFGPNRQLVEVKEMECTQRMRCLSDGFRQAKTTEPCPDGPEYTAAGCANVVVQKAVNPDDFEFLKCEGTDMKMFVKDKDNFWTELSGDTIKCNIDTGMWDAKIAVRSEGQQVEQEYIVESLPENAFYCAKSNPSVRPTTTTTTTTPAPPEPICELCKNLLPKCETCNATEAIFEDVKNENNVCKMTVKDGSKLFVKNNEEVKEILCERKEDAEEMQWTSNGLKVEEFSSRKPPAKTAWGVVHYVVAGVTFLLIGGMAISCVVIYLRMRKQISEKEKKKERGVTKKYTTANVMKTSGKSSGLASEVGKSREPTKSKLDEQEDAPTLKL